MRNFLLAVLFLGGLITGSVLFLQEVRKRHLNKPIRSTPPAPLPVSATNRTNHPGNTNQVTSISNTNTEDKRSDHITRRIHPGKHPLPANGKTSLPSFIKIFRKAMKKVKSARIPKIPAGANAIITIPHVVLRAIPSVTGKQVALLYRGNEIKITGKAVSNFYPCSVFKTRGYIPATSLEKATGQERKKYQMDLPGLGEDNPSDAMAAVIQALHSRNRMHLIRMVFRTIRISVKEYPTGPFRVSRETLRNTGRHRNLDSRPYSSGISLWQLFNWSNRFLPSGTIQLKKDRKYFTWPPEGRFRISFIRKGNRWFLSEIAVDRELRP